MAPGSPPLPGPRGTLRREEGQSSLEEGDEERRETWVPAEEREFIQSCLELGLVETHREPRVGAVTCGSLSHLPAPTLGMQAPSFRLEVPSAV